MFATAQAKVLAITALVLVALIALAAVTFIPSPKPKEDLKSASVISQSGLDLTLKVNTTTIHSSEGIDVVAQVRNTLAQNVTVLPNDTLYHNVPDWSQYSIGACVGVSLISLALSIGVFRGRYAGANISSAGNPLLLIPPQSVPCPATPTLASLKFQPHDDSAEAELNTFTGPQNRTITVTLQLNSTSTACGDPNNTCGYTPGIRGYWTGSANPPGPSAAFRYFDAGGYTLVASDSWGQTVYLYIEVI